MMIRDSSFKNICFHKARFEICKQKIDATWIFWVLKVGSTFKGESANVSKNWLRIGLLVVMLKSPIRINFSNLLESLLIIIFNVFTKVEWFVYLCNKNFTFAYCYLYSQNFNVCKILKFFGPAWQLISNIKSNSTLKFVSISSYKFVTRQQFDCLARTHLA